MKTGELPPPKKNECLKCQVGCQFFQHLGGSGSLKITQQTSNCHPAGGSFAAGKTLEKFVSQFFCFQISWPFFACKFAIGKSYICWLHFKHFIGRKNTISHWNNQHGSGDVDLQRCPENGGCGCQCCFGLGKKKKHGRTREKLQNDREGLVTKGMKQNQKMTLRL